jgi:O-antigen/teichoic acid export membrane protein
VYLENIVLPISRFLLIAVAIAAGFRAIGVAWAYTISYGLVAVLSTLYLIRRTPLFSSAEPELMHGKLLKFSTPLMITATTAILFSNVDTFIIGYFSSTGQVGIYNVVYPLAALLSTVLRSFGFIFMPSISELHSSGKVEEMGRTFQVVSKWILIATLPLFLIIVSYPDVVISATFGSEYVPGGLALSILAIGFFTHSISGPAGNTLTAIGMPQRVMYTNLVVILMNVALNLYLIPRYGIVGAAVATTVGYALMNSLFLIQLQRETGLHPFRSSFFQPAVVALTLWTILYISAQSFSRTLSVLLLLSLIFSIVYFVIILRYGGVEYEEKMLVSRLQEEFGISLNRLRWIARLIMK